MLNEEFHIIINVTVKKVDLEQGGWEVFVNPIRDLSLFANRKVTTRPP